MKATATKVAITRYEPLIRSFIRFWEREHTYPMRGHLFREVPNPPLWSQPPKVVDIVDWLVSTGLSHDDACAMLDALVERGRLSMRPDGRPAFTDDPLYHWVRVVG